jgi:hypothetical protein
MKTKVCSECGKRKDVKLFRVRGNGRQGSCKKCRSSYDKKHYKRRTDLYLKRNERRKEVVAEWFAELKDKHCMDCGGKFPPCVLEFDHREGEKKEGTISNLVHGFRTKAARAEIKKCDLVCANCHRIRTHMRSIAKGNRC